MAEHGERDVYFEFTAIGNAVKVTAIDSLTGIESRQWGLRARRRSICSSSRLQKVQMQLKRG